MKFDELVRVSSAVAATSGRLEKISQLAALLSRASLDEVPIAIGFLTGWPRQGKLGVAWATISAARKHEAATTPTLELRDVDAVFDKLASVSGKNSGKERARILGELFARATTEEQG